MKKRFLLVVTAIVCLLACVLALAACASKDEPSAHTHSYQWVDNGDGTHSGRCSVAGCDNPNVKNETHIFGANGKCEKCSAVKPDGHTHVWSQTYETNDTHHWQSCTVSGCSEKNGYAEHDYSNGDCVCGKEKPTQGGEHEHTYSRDWTSVGAEGHYHVATCEHTDEHTAVIPHAYDNAEDTTCNDCGYVRTVEPSHTHSLTRTAATAATCMQDGNIEYWYCSDCDKYFSDDNGNTDIAFADTVIDKLGHDLQYVAAQSATCANVGWNAYDRCKRVNCGYSTKTVIPATGKHTGGTATCTAKAVCTVCRNEYGEIDADNHNIQHHDAQAATCTTDGWNAYDTCSRCDYTTKEILKAKGHTLDENTICTVCGITVGTRGLWYKLNDGGESYSVIESRCEANNIFIPPEYNGKPVTGIEDLAFWKYCVGLTSVTIPDSVTSIGAAFGYCHRLESIKVASNNKKYHSSGNCIIETENKKMVAGCKNSLIPDDGSVTSIGDNAFIGCSGLTSVTIPDSVTSIGSNAFTYCSGLTSVTIPDSVTSIGEWAFSDSGLTSITIPGSVTSIMKHAFTNCSGLTSVTIGGGVTSIGDGAFRDCGGLTSITIPDSVTSIGDLSFYDCSNLTSVTIGNSVTSIGSSAFGSASFNGYSNLEIVYWNAAACESVGSAMFGNCTKLTTVVIGDNVTTIPGSAFSGCSGLTSITFNGTKAQWKAVLKGINWNYDTGNYTVTCTDGKLDKDGNEVTE